jgi:hypothetical protein
MKWSAAMKRQKRTVNGTYPDTPGPGRAHAMLVRGICWTLAASLSLQAQTGGAGSESLRVVVVEGGGAINNLVARTARDPVVQVLDASGKPVSGATVTFTLPSTGPSGSFLDGSETATVRTGEDGRAVARGLKPNRTAGQFTIRVIASWRGQTGRAAIVQTNAGSVSNGSRNKKIIIATVIAGAVAGAVLAASGGGGNSGGSPAPTPVATPPVAGTPVFGPPR